MIALKNVIPIRWIKGNKLKRENYAKKELQITDIHINNIKFFTKKWLNFLYQLQNFVRKLRASQYEGDNWEISDICLFYKI